MIKANFDGAWSRENHESGSGVFFHTSSGSIIAGASKPYFSSSANQTEAKVALLTVRSANDNNFQGMAFESDSLELISCINGDFKKGDISCINGDFKKGD
ncbi:hypothetical protein C1H46_014723 [Malus baccata]|uniref:RNase H type-1 domain-containing protein n=1 Tax=Malus baccata TaxID=106549 RepID=A0A540MLI0_MALBA|nr:hypothetical protein C1H46_014722 [Malus baccata]TQD99665.1 hypothetical protein C1H46_014723 [Malus baccata]